MKIKFLSRDPLTLRQHGTRAFAAVFLMPVMIGTQLVMGTPGPDWLLAYAKKVEKLAGKEGFTWA